MKKTLDTAKIVNELEESAFFRLKKRQQPQEATERELVPPVLGVPPVPRAKRVMKQRQPFDIYQDQYDKLKQLALEERMQGGVGSMSAMVRDAIDKLITERRKQLI